MVRLQTPDVGYRPRRAGLETCALGADPPIGVSSDPHLGFSDPLRVRDPCG